MIPRRGQRRTACIECDPGVRLTCGPQATAEIFGKDAGRGRPDALLIHDLSAYEIRTRTALAEFPSRSQAVLRSLTTSNLVGGITRRSMRSANSANPCHAFKIPQSAPASQQKHPLRLMRKPVHSNKGN